MCLKHHKVVECITHEVESVEKDFERMQVVLKDKFSERIALTDMVYANAN